MKRKIVIGVVLLSLVAAGCSKATTTQNTSTETTQQTNQDTPQSTNTTPTQQPTTPPSANTYTLAQVKAHSKQTDCWLAVNGSVYNVTSFIPKHPGGPAKIIPLCGTDASKAFEAQHDGAPKPEAMLASLKIGTLSQ